MISDGAGKDDRQRETTIDALTLLNDLRYPTGKLKRSSILRIIRETLDEIFQTVAPIGSDSESVFRLIARDTVIKGRLRLLQMLQEKVDSSSNRRING